MTPGLSAIANGYVSHLATFGETGTFRGLSESIIVNRLTQSKAIGGKIEATLPEGATIQLRATLTPPPKQGEVITDSYGVKHRIEKVNPIGYCFQVECATNQYADR